MCFILFAVPLRYLPTMTCCSSVSYDCFDVFFFWDSFMFILNDCGVINGNQNIILCRPQLVSGADVLLDSRWVSLLVV